MSGAPATGTIHRLHILTPVFGVGYSYHIRLAPKINVSESDVDDEDVSRRMDDEFAEAAAIIIQIL